MYAFVRDIDFKEGLKIVTPAGLDEDQLAAKMARVNALTPCSSRLFSIPQQFIMKQELVDDILAGLIVKPAANGDSQASKDELGSIGTRS